MPPIVRTPALVALLLASAATPARPAPPALGGTLPGFTLVGESWTYDPGDGGVLITGKLIQPTTGTPPHPAVLISHGQSGTAAGFSAQKAAVLRTWGVVCIAPDYTHASASFPPGTDGWSPENERRARACLAILASRADVDMTRVAAYGNSKGAFLTAGLCGATLPGEIRAAAITAGGTSGTTSTTAAAPALQEVQGIAAPFLLLHGETDTTVLRVQSAHLASILAANGVAEHRYVWANVGHSLHADRAAEVFALMRAWFSAHGVLGEPGNSPPTASAIADLALPQNTGSGALPFTVGDAQSTPDVLLVSAFTLDPAILPQSGIALSGTDASRSIELTPATDASGSATIVVVVDDGELSTATSFRIAVGNSSHASFCTGDGLDPAVTTPCPCANVGVWGHGCAHSSNPQGGLLAASGTTSPETISLVASSMPATASCIFLQGDALADTVFGDGVRCAGGSLVRLRTRTSTAGSALFPGSGDPSLSTRGQVTPGSGAARYYQVYYRNASPTFCPPATFNVTNGWRVVW